MSSALAGTDTGDNGQPANAGLLLRLIARRVPSENTVTLRRKAGPSVLTPTHQATASAPATARSATLGSSTEPLTKALGLLRPRTRCSLRRRRRDARPFWPARRVRGQCRCWLRKRRCGSASVSDECHWSNRSVRRGFLPRRAQGAPRVARGRPPIRSPRRRFSL